MVNKQKTKRRKAKRPRRYFVVVKHRGTKREDTLTAMIVAKNKKEAIKKAKRKFLIDVKYSKVMSL